MGSRVALTLLADNQYPIDKVLLIAPDGIDTHPVFQFATGSRLGSWLFNKTISNLKVVYTFCAILHKIGIVHAIIVNLLLKLSRDKEATRQLYNYWVVYGKLNPNWQAINNRLNKGLSTLHVLFGKSDVFISTRHANTVIKLCPGATAVVLPVGHYIKDEAFVTYAKNYLQ